MEKENNIQNIVRETVPIEDLQFKTFLTIYEMSQLTGLGINLIRRLTNRNPDKFILWVGNKRLIKNKAFREWLEMQTEV